MTTTVEFAPKEKTDEFESKLSDSNLMAITHRITLEVVDFVDMQKFNEQQVKAGDFDETKKEYIKENSKLSMIELMARNEFRTKLSDAGMYVEKIAICSKPFGLENSLQGMLEKIKNDIANSISITPPPHTTNNNCNSETGEQL